MVYSSNRFGLDFFEIISRRRSVRSYSARTVEETKLKRIFEAANSAPSAGNLQAYRVFAFTDPLKRNALASAAFDQQFIGQAPVCLVFCADPARSAEKYGQRGSGLYSLQDATIAASFAMLAAVDLGLATVWVGDFDESRVQAVIGSESLRPVAMLPIGYASEEPEPTARRAIEEIFAGDFPQTD